MESKIPALNEEMRTDIILFSSMVGERGSTWETRFFLEGVVSEAKSPAEDPATPTMHKIWADLVMVLWLLGERGCGLMPIGQGGSSRRSICQGLQRLLACPCVEVTGSPYGQLSADLDYLSNCLELRHFNSLTPCAPHVGVTAALCRGQRLAPDATWK